MRRCAWLTLSHSPITCRHPQQRPAVPRLRPAGSRPYCTQLFDLKSITSNTPYGQASADYSIRCFVFIFLDRVKIKTVLCNLHPRYLLQEVKSIRDKPFCIQISDVFASLSITRISIFCQIALSSFWCADVYLELTRRHISLTMAVSSRPATLACSISSGGPSCP